MRNQAFPIRPNSRLNSMLNGKSSRKAAATMKPIEVISRPSQQHVETGGDGEQDGRQALVMADAALESYQTGKAVKL